MNSTKLQNTKLMHSNLLLFYTLTIKDQKHKLRKQFHLPLHLNYQTTWLASWEICMQVKKQQLELDMEQQTGSKSGKEYIKAVYCHPAYLTYMLSTSCKMPD